MANVDTHEDNPYEENSESGREPGATGNGYAFTVSGMNSKKGTCTLIVGGVELTEILIDSGAGKNVIAQGKWEYLKNQGIQCESRKAAPNFICLWPESVRNCWNIYCRDYVRGHKCNLYC